MKKESTLTTVLTGLLLFILGVMLVAVTENLLITFNYILVCIFAVIGIIQIINFFVNKHYQENMYISLILGNTFIWLSLILYIYYMVIINILPILFSLYLFILGSLLLMRYFVYKNNLKIKYYRYLIMGATSLIIGVLLIFEPLWSVYVYLKITGVYTILLSMLFFIEALNNKKVNKLSS